MKKRSLAIVMAMVVMAALVGSVGFAATKRLSNKDISGTYSEPGGAYYMFDGSRNFTFVLPANISPQAYGTGKGTYKVSGQTLTVTFSKKKTDFTGTIASSIIGLSTTFTILEDGAKLLSDAGVSWSK